MNCKKVQNRLYDYTKNEVSQSVSNKIKDHLNLCKKCKNEFNKIMKIKELFKTDYIKLSFLTYFKIEYKISEKLNIIYHFRYAITFFVLILFLLFGTLFLKQNKEIEKNNFYEFFYNSYYFIDTDYSDDEIDIFNNYM